MKKEKVGITILILFITITTSINIVLLNKSSKLLGTIPSRNIDSNEVEYTSEKTVQGAINDLAEKANIIGTDEEKNKFRDDSKTLIGQIGTDKLNTTSQNLIGAINELNSNLISKEVSSNYVTECKFIKKGKIIGVSLNDFKNITSEGLYTICKAPTNAYLPALTYVSDYSSHSDGHVRVYFSSGDGTVSIYYYGGVISNFKIEFYVPSI